MTLRIFFLLIALGIALHVHAGMARVTAVLDGQTITIERGGTATNVRLAGITLTDARSAKALLDWTLASAWVMVEEQADGQVLVYRSPDALFLNRELVLRGYARATAPGIEPTSHVVVTYLGTLMPPRQPLLNTGPAAGSGSGTSRPAPKRPSPPRPARTRASRR
jgi:endonuclease YncB( thermonuclease family)